MQRQNFKWIGVAVLVAAAGWRLWMALRSDPGVSERAWFYDLSEKKLFVAQRGLVPPIRGINSSEEDGVRAVVVAPPGKCDDPAARRIAYLDPRHGERITNACCASDPASWQMGPRSSSWPPAGCSSETRVTGMAGTR